MYRGQGFLIPLGQGGIVSDQPQSRMPPSKLIEAQNVTLVNGYCEKSSGIRPWNRGNPATGSTTISGGVATFSEYYPNSLNQRVLVLSKTGALYKFSNQYVRTQVTADLSNLAPTTLLVGPDPHIASGGQEIPGAKKKAFIFSGLSQVQVVEGDGTTYRPIKKPAFDWASSYPTFGVSFRGRLWCFGNSNVPDFLYASAEGDQEDFQKTSTPAQATDFQFFDVAPGEGNGISGLFVFKNRLFICKSPSGLYQLNDDDPNPANWYVTRVNADFGLSGAHGIAQIFDDVLIYNTQGTVTSLSAAFQFGDIESADVLNKLFAERYFRQNTSGYGNSNSYGLFYQEKKQIYFTFRSSSGVKQDRILVLDYFNKEPELLISTKDQPNCLGLIEDSSGIARPIYGSDDGNLYELDYPNRLLQYYDTQDYTLPQGYWQEDYAVGSSSYNFIAQTPHMDFGFADLALGQRTKRWDFLELTFQPTGDWNVSVDVYIDSEYTETINFNLNRDRPLGPYYGSIYPYTDTTTQGSQATVTVPSTETDEIILTNPGLTNISGMTVGANGKDILLTNLTGNSITITNDLAYFPSNQRFVIATGGLNDFITLPNGWSCRFMYSSAFSSWCQFDLSIQIYYPFQKYGFLLGTDRLDGDFPKSLRKPLHGQGRTISFKLRSSGLSQNIKLQSLMVYFRSADERQIKDPRR